MIILCAVLCLVAQSYPDLCNPVDCSLPSMGIVQARVLEWVTMPSSRYDYAYGIEYKNTLSNLRPQRCPYIFSSESYTSLCHLVLLSFA